MTVSPMAIRAVELEHPQFWVPALELVHPVAERGFRHHHQVRAGYVLELVQVAQHRDGLQGLAWKRGGKFKQVLAFQHRRRAHIHIW